MRKRNWWQRLSFDFLYKSRRSSRRPFHRIQPRFEPLENRLAPANLHVDSVSIFATASGSTTPVDGEWITARVNYTTTALNLADIYNIEFDLDGVKVSLTNLTDGAGLSTLPVTKDLGSWVLKPGAHTLTVTLDVPDQVSETDDTDNVGTLNFSATAPTTLPQKLIWPTAPQQASLMGVVSYVDALPGSGAQDYRGLSIATNGNNGIDIKAGNFTLMDGGLPIYAAAGGTVSSVVDGNFDRENSVNGNPANSITIDLGGGWTTTYSHLLANATTVKFGDTVTQGQLIGLMGSSGNSTDVDLHFQLQFNGNTVEPFVNIPTYFADPLPTYQGDQTPYAEASGISNYNTDYQERPSSKTTFATTEADDVRFWARISHLNSGDQLTFRWYRPDGSLQTQSTYTASGVERYVVYPALLTPATWSQYLGTWEVAVSLGGTELARQSFQVVGPGGAVPEILIRDAGGRLIPSGRTTPIDFGSFAQGGSGPTLTFSVQNHSGGVLAITGIDLPPGFLLVGLLPSSVAANSSTAITLRLDTSFATSVVGAKFGAVRLLTNDADESSYSFNVKGTVTGTPVAGTPSITLPTTVALAYSIGTSPIKISPDAVFADSDSINFNTGQVKIEFASGGQGGDKLTLLDGGLPGPGVINISGTDLKVNGVVVGTYTPGTSTAPLIVDLNSSADVAAVEAILRGVAYSNVDFLSTTPRYVRFTVIDETGKVSNMPIRTIDTDVRTTVPGTVTGIPFSPGTVITSTANGARSVVTADIDRDGNLDVVTASSLDNRISWYRNLGNGTFGSRQTISTTASGASSVFAIDLDGDGDLDVLSASYTDNKIAWYENVAGSFTLHTISTTAMGARSVFAIDMDGDGDMDVVSASFLDNKIAWYRNDGSQSFTLVTISTTALGAMSVTAADLDGDGDMDVLAASFTNNTIAWYQNDGSQSFTLRIISTTAVGAMSVAVGDVNSDGHLDVLSASFGDDKIAWYANNGAATPTFTPYTVTLGADGARAATAVDLDGDGDTDILAASYYDDTIAWFENDGNQNFTQRVITTTADGAFAVAAADLDRDGDRDVVAASYLDDTVATFRNETIHRSATFSPPHGITSSADGAFFVLPADLDRDGKVDVLSTSLLANNIVWNRNNGDGTFTRRLIDAGIAGPPNFGPTSLAVADIDGDGDLDIVASLFSDNKIVWYRNDGAENFTRITVTTTAVGAMSVAVADIDGDGDMDIVAASFEDDTIAWYQNSGAATPIFTKRIIATTADGPRCVAVADINGDGFLDVLSASYNDDKIAWYENSGAVTPTFVRRTITTSASGAMSLFVADVDRDGDLDVLSASYSDNTIAWYSNIGSGAFSGANIISSTADKARSVWAADLDGDGDVDVLSASLNDNKIAWYENNGSQFFSLRTITTSALGAISVAAADLDGDGDMDVVSASYFGDSIDWYENRGGQFALATTSTAPVGITQGAMDDVLKIVMTHKGRTGDHDEELFSLDLLFDDGVNTLDSLQANALIENLFIYRDTGNGIFSGADTLVATVTDLDLILGVQKVSFTDGDPNVRVIFGTPATFFVVVELTADATMQTPSEFRITHLTQSTSKAEDRVADLPVRLEFVANFTSPLVDALVAPAITSGNATTFTVDAFGTFTVTATGGPLPALTVGGVPLPNGVTFVDNGNGTATLSGTPTGLVAGTYNLIITANNGVNPNAVQNPFTLTVLPGALVKVGFVQQPTNTVAGASIAPSVTVQLQDTYGNAISQLGTAISMILLTGSGTLSGTTPRTTNSNGLATFNDLSINLTGVKSLQASSSGLSSATSNNFTITSAAANHVVFVQQPTDATAGVAISPSITVRLLDQFDNIVNQSGTSITLSLFTGSGALSGTVARTTNASGLATFNDLSVNLIGVKSLRATSGVLTAATSSNFIITAAAASQVVFVQQPINTTAGANITPAVTVQLRDQFGNDVSQSGTTVTMSQFSGTGTLLGTLPQVTNGSGLATFNDLHINVAGAKMLQASSSGLSSATSNSFTINADVATHVVFVQQPTDTTAGTTIPNVTVQLKDQFGNSVSTPSVGITMALISGSGSLLGTTSQLTNGSGLATFNNLQINIAGLKTLQAASTGLGTVDSNLFTITATAASKVIFVQQPSNAMAGNSVSPAVTVQLKDQFDNDVSQSGVSVNMALFTGTGTLSGTTSQNTNASGLATFNDLSVNLVGTKSLQATSSLLTSATSASFNITANFAFQFAFVQQPTDTGAGNVIFPAVTVQLRDGFGNDVSQSGVAIGMALISGTGTLLGTTSQNTDATGLATFNDLQINILGTKMLQASGSGLGTLNSSSFNITAGAAAAVQFVQQPSNATVNTDISPAVTVQIVDQFGNSVSQSGTSITLSLATGSGGLSGATATTDAAGLATFTNLQADTAEAGTKTLQADSGVLTIDISSSFLINDVANHVVFVQQPTNTSTGTSIAPPITVRLKDQFDNNVGQAGTTITISLNGTGTLSGTMSQLTNASGVATFNDLSIDFTGLKSLDADSGALTGATSNTFNISAPATNVVFVQQPTDTTAGNPIAPPITVQLKDFFDTDVTQASISITIALISGSGALLGTTTQVTDVNGLATFSNLQINAAGTGKVLQATSGSLTSADSTSFTINTAAASKVVFVQQPTDRTAGSNITPSVTVQLRDPFDNDVTQSSVNVDMSLFLGTGTLLGTTTQATDVNGLATFNDLHFHIAGLKSLQAASGALTVATSGSFTISAAAASKVVFTQQPTNTLAGAAIAPAVAVQLQDQFDNNVSQSGTSINMALASGSGVLLGTTAQVTNAGGVATFNNLRINIAGAKSLHATSSGVTDATSAGFNINAVADRVEFVQQPGNATAGAVINPVTVQLKDPFGNLISQPNVAVNMALFAGSGALLGTLTRLTNASGLATFDDLHINAAGVKTLRASSAGLLFANSASFSIAAAVAKKLGFLNQPKNVRAGNTMPPVIIQLFDEFGNAVAKGGVVVKLSLISGGLRKEYSAKTNAAGQAIFRNLQPMRRGPAKLVARSDGLLTAASNPFQVLVNPNFPWL